MLLAEREKLLNLQGNQLRLRKLWAWTAIGATTLVGITSVYFYYAMVTFYYYLICAIRNSLSDFIDWSKHNISLSSALVGINLILLAGLAAICIIFPAVWLFVSMLAAALVLNLVVTLPILYAGIVAIIGIFIVIPYLCAVNYKGTTIAERLGKVLDFLDEIGVPDSGFGTLLRRLYKKLSPQQPEALSELDVNAEEAKFLELSNSEEDVSEQVANERLICLTNLKKYKNLMANYDGKTTVADVNRCVTSYNKAFDDLQKLLEKLIKDLRLNPIRAFEEKLPAFSAIKNKQVEHAIAAYNDERGSKCCICLDERLDDIVIFKNKAPLAEQLLEEKENAKKLPAAPEPLCESCMNKCHTPYEIKKSSNDTYTGLHPVKRVRIENFNQIIHHQDQEHLARLKQLSSAVETAVNQYNGECYFRNVFVNSSKASDSVSHVVSTGSREQHHLDLDQKRTNVAEETEHATHAQQSDPSGSVMTTKLSNKPF